MEKEIKLVNNVEGSIVSDKMNDTLDMRASDMAEAGRLVGNLEGELKVANQLIEQNIKDTDRKLTEASNKVVLDVVAEGNLVYDDFRGWVKNPGYIKKMSISNANVYDLADAAVKSQALKDVEKANKDVEAIKEKMEAMEATHKRNEKRSQEQVNNAEKTKKKAIEDGIERAEKQNIRTIGELNLEIKALNKEHDIMVDKFDLLEKERDLALEAQQADMAILQKKIDILEANKQDWKNKIANLFHSWKFRSRLNNIGHERF